MNQSTNQAGNIVPAETEQPADTGGLTTEQISDSELKEVTGGSIPKIIVPYVSD